MVDNIPLSDVPDIREYLYIDRPRVRSLLAQIRDGAPSNESRQRSRVSKLQINLKAMTSESGRSNSTSLESVLEDLHVSMLEQDSEALGYLSDVTEEAKRPEFWKKGKARQKLTPGRLLRVTAPTLIFDPQQIISGFTSLDTQFSDPEFDETMTDMTSMLSVLYGDHVLVNIFPQDAKERSFRGQIDQADSSELLDRSSLIARFGSERQTLTSVLTVSRVLQGENEEATLQKVLPKLPKLIADHQREKLSRVEFDEFVSMLVETLESTGLQSAPEFPAVSVIPLAIYRQLELPVPFAENDFHE